MRKAGLLVRAGWTRCMGEAYRAEGGAGNGGGCTEGRRPVEKTVDNCEWRRIERGFRGSRVENFCVLGDKKRAMFHVEHRQVRGTGFEVRGAGIVPRGIFGNAASSDARSGGRHRLIR